MLQVKTFVISSLAALLLMVSACENSTSPGNEVDFDRREMLSNYANNIILPSFETLQKSVSDLKVVADDFEANPTAEGLDTLQSTLKKVRLDWQQTSPFQFGPAESAVLRVSLNTYPTDTVKVNDYISSGSYSFGSLDSRDVSGLPALGYLLHGVGETQEEILAMYTTDDKAGNRMNYLMGNISYVKGLVDTVTNDWQASGGNYIGMFLGEDNAGTDTGSSLGMLINSLVLHYEKFVRNGKIGIPAGVFNTNRDSYPEKVEAYYGGYSAELAVASVKAIRRLFLGNGESDTAGKGLDDNLQALGATNLSGEIKKELNEAIVALEELSDPLAQQIEGDNEPVFSAFEELQDVIVLLKADMTSVLGITITYKDNDSD